MNISTFREITKTMTINNSKEKYLTRQSICHNLYDWNKIEHFLELGGSSSNFIKYIETTPKICLVDVVRPEYDQKNLFYINSDLNEGIPFKPETFDAVFAGEIIEHLLDTDEFLNEIHRILKPKGILVLTTPNASSFINLYKWLKKDQFVHNDYKIGQSGHVRYYSPKALIRQIKARGFTVLKVLDTPNIATLFKNNWIRKYFYFVRKKLFPLRGANIIVQCSK